MKYQNPSRSPVNRGGLGSTMQLSTVIDPLYANKALNLDDTKRNDINIFDMTHE